MRAQNAAKWTRSDVILLGRILPVPHSALRDEKDSHHDDAA